jgi:hypothetical protein
MFPCKRLPASLAATALALAACNSPDRSAATAATPESQGPGFARDMIALKAKGLPDAEREEAIRALLARYGRAPAHAAPAIAGEPEGETAPEPLAKTAATSWLTVKTTSFTFPYVIKQEMNVAAGGTLTATLEAAPGADFTDPFLLAYYQSSGIVGVKAYPIKVVGFNDDNGGLNSSFSWTNNTGSVKLVTVIGFAYSPSTGGPMRMRTSYPPFPGPTGGIGQESSLLIVSGIAKYDNEVTKFNCLGPTNTRVSLTRVAGSSSLKHTAVVVNANTLTGALAYGSTTTQNVSVGSVVASGYPNLFLTFVPWQDIDRDDGVTSYTARQQNSYACDLLP